MDIYNLPWDIFPNQTFEKDDIIIHNYEAAMASFKGKSILHTNSISLVIQGQKTIHFAEKTVVIKDDEFHFLSSGNCLASMDLSKQNTFKSILMFFDDVVLAEFYLKYDNLIRNIKNKDTIVHQPYIALKKDDFIYNYVAFLELTFSNKTPLSKPMKQLKFEELMLYLLEKYPLEILSFKSDKKTYFDDLKIRKAVEANVTNNLTLEELAFLCNLSLSTFKRRFTEIYNTSPNKWILQRRMKIAATLLANYKERPSEVFHKLGYENHSSFTKSFKQVFGITPKEYQSQKLNV